MYRAFFCGAIEYVHFVSLGVLGELDHEISETNLWLIEVYDSNNVRRSQNYSA